MKFECNKEKISAAISRADRITGKNVSLPVLACILIEAQKDKVIIKSTNLDIGLEMSISCKVSEPGIVAVSGGILNSYLSSLGKNDSTLNFSLQNDNLYISSKNSETVIKTHPHDDFPNIPRIKEEKSFRIEPKDLLRGFQSVWYSASISNIKPELSSVYIYPEGENIYFVATDSFRLAEKNVRIGKTEGFQSILIPFKNTTEIARVFDDSGEPIDIFFDENQIVLKNDEVYVISRIVDGVFPDYKQIIPKTEGTVVNVLKDDFVQAMRISNIFSNNFNQTTISIIPSDGVVEISTQNKDKGETINRVKANIEGEAIKISFNHKYINDCLGSINSDTLKLIFNGNGKPLVIMGSKDSTFRYLVMPMNK